jgi:glucose-6-phosphate 1-dehydrogenase
MTTGGGIPQLEPAIIVIFGITGDLSQRYLLPALYNLIKDNLLPPQTRILGVTRRDLSTDDLLDKVELCVTEANQTCDPDVLKAVRERTSIFKMDLEDPAAYDALLHKLNGMEEQAGMCLNRLYYLSIPPKAYGPVVRLLGESGLNTTCQHGQAAVRLLVEKPFGHDLPSAERLVAETGRHFDEEQVYRIDHYMAKPAVMDLMAARLRDEHLDTIWNSNHLAGVEIAAKETIGIEGRAEFYDGVGGLRDFVQSHLVQILGLVVMDRPESFDSGHLHAKKEAGLEQIEPVPKEKVSERAVRGRYRGYREVVNNPASTTETFAAVTVYSQNPRWQEVPLTMLTGKKLDERITKITAKLKSPLPSGETELSWVSKGGNTYERVLLDAISGDRTIFSSSREVLASWRILQPVLDSWQKTADDLIIYEPGSAGPTLESVKL